MIRGHHPDVLGSADLDILQDTFFSYQGRMKLCQVWVVIQLCSVLFLCRPSLVKAFERCPTDRGGGICPDGNTCCMRSGGKSGCISGDMGKFYATCCSDDLLSGCPAGYVCEASDGRQRCHAVNRTKFTDPLVQMLPRYRLCDSKGIRTVHGLNTTEKSKLAYYSTHGPIEAILNSETSQTIDMVLIIIHGANRNGDDYLCSTNACVELQNNFEDVLIIAPQFYAESDVRPRKEILFWDSTKDGSWRYGADSLGPASISSFTAMDILVDTLWRGLDNLKKMVVAGHSSGAQTVQRWSLLTSQWEKEGMHSVVANPSSYAYLEPSRLISSIWQIPLHCDMYNRWEWGLSDGGPMNVPYRDRAMQNTTELISRFRQRRVIYLSGSQDRCNTSAVDGWCQSHGLETTCMDEMQGETRLQRSLRYMSSLKRLKFDDIGKHSLHIVPGVGHDHAMMFQSPHGINALFEGAHRKYHRDPDVVPQ